MPRILKSIDIGVSPENVFNYVTNTSTQPDWIKFVQAVDITSGDGQSKGTTLGRRSPATNRIPTRKPSERSLVSGPY